MIILDSTEPNQELRPNIWQVCEIAFKLQSKENPVTNIQVSIKWLIFLLHLNDTMNNIF